MTASLAISIGQYSDKGRKSINQDFHGALVPEPGARGTKGVAVALADGISSSNVSHIAAETAIKSFLTDYYCTSETWSVKTSAHRVIAATNSWLFAQSSRGEHADDMDRGYVCTLSVMVLKSRLAHIFHVGDARVFRLSGDALEQLTTDHRVVVSSRQSYLARALGMGPGIEIDYRSLPIEAGDLFILATDGVYEHVPPGVMAKTVRRHEGPLDGAAEAIARAAYERGSSDNLTVQIVRVDAVPLGEAHEFVDDESGLKPPPLPEPRATIDGFRILRSIHASSRSHIYVAEDAGTGTHVALKIPSIDLRDDPAYLKRFKMEEWVARRINSAHVLRAYPMTRRRTALYSVSELVEGQTLRQWMLDHPRPALDTVRGIVEQIAKGLRAFHRKEMLHQDLRPENVMIDRAGTVKIIDFGATRLAGVLEDEPGGDDGDILGTMQYTAPEYFAGLGGSARSDHFSLAVMAYEMLTGELPYGAQVARVRRPGDLGKLRYVSACRYRPDIPDWVDGALRKAMHPDPGGRYEALSEFEFDLRHPRAQFTRKSRAALLERNPVLLWQLVSLLLACAVVALLVLPRLK